MARHDTPEWLSTVILVVALIAFCWFGVKMGTQLPTSIPQPAPVQQSVCNSVVERCKATVDTNLDAYDDNHCDDEKARKAIDKMLREPLGLGDCTDIIQRLSASCPEHCELEGKDYLVVPSKTDFRSAQKADESGRCWAHGEVAVTVRGRCLRKQE
ncbi:MAG: hypothetical protein U0136_01220 [Bdellovibrionota bacterium]